MPDRRVRRSSRPAAAAPRPKRRTVARPALLPPVRKAARPEAVVAVDVGNSDAVIGWFRGESLEGFWRVTSISRTGDEAALLLTSLFSQAGGERSALAGAGAVLCSVVPTLSRSWVQALARLTGGTPLEVSARTATSLPIRYRDKSAVGADRIANAIAVRALYGTPAIVVDLGTATTFDCVSAEGAYLGGVIAPGIGTSADELFRRAARLPKVELRRPERALGRTTEESLQAGVIWGAAGQVDALVRRLTIEMRGTPHVIATGGFAPVLAPECETINRVDEGLTLKGMRLLWESSR